MVFFQKYFRPRHTVKPLVYLTLQFMEQFAADKAKENVIDFSDMEHFALKILVDEEGNPTDTAKWYQDYYAQVMIDEYQRHTKPHLHYKQFPLFPVPSEDKRHG